MQTIPITMPAIMKALGDENRLKILLLLKNGSLCACEILARLQISQSTLSHHMSILAKAELVTAWPVGKWTHYRLCPQGFELALSFIGQLQASASSQAAEHRNIKPSQAACALKPKTGLSLA